MTKVGAICTILVLSAAPAHATLTLGATGIAYVYETSAQVTGAIRPVGTLGNAFGGLCNSLNTAGGTNCTSVGVLAGFPGTVSGGVISMKTPTANGTNYMLTLQITGYTSTPFSASGDIWDVVANGVNEGTTTPVGALTTGAGAGMSLTFFVRDSLTPLAVTVTDLTEQYVGIRDTLPGDLNSANASLNSAPGTTLSGHAADVFTLKATITGAPEPASLSLFAGGIAALGALRRRRRV